MAPTRFQRVHGGPRRVVGEQDRDPRHHWKGAALAPEHALRDHLVVAEGRAGIDEGQTGATERTTKPVEEGRAHRLSLPGPVLRRRRETIEKGLAGAPDLGAPVVFNAEQTG